MSAATECDMAVFLLCKSIDDGDAGFKTAHERGVYKNAKGADAICRRHGLSIFSTLAGCKELFEALPQGRRIATGKLNKKLGKACETESLYSDHQTWWPYDGIKRSEAFKFIE